MKIVIEIPKKLYEYMTHSATISNKEAVQWFVDFHKRIFVDATPLPKGHGDLIDRNDLMDRCVTYLESSGATTNLIKSAITIIEADKEGADK